VSDKTALPDYRSVDAAPIVYFDIVAANGVMNGAVQIELASRILPPTSDGGVHVEFLTTGRIRCSTAAAMALRNAIDGSLEMLKQPSEPTAVPGKLN
jgi:hypothetical protein